jgi:multidrug resistance efflux pump
VRNTVQRRSRSRTLLLVIPALVMACAAGYGWCYWTVGQFLESTGLCIFAIS